MLLRMRDMLYEGSWDDFERDLEARAADKPHVFSTVPLSPSMKATIAGHLVMIERMRAWEEEHGCMLDADDETA